MQTNRKQKQKGGRVDRDRQKGDAFIFQIGHPIENAYDARGLIISQKNGLGDVTGYIATTRWAKSCQGKTGRQDHRLFLRRAEPAGAGCLRRWRHQEIYP